jgi:ppGpp synthetase/RelA/SpoT-type nucleotidyltranferase
LQVIAFGLQELCLDHLAGTPNIDRVTARAKHPDRFAAKIHNVDDEGRLKYNAPLTEVQDQLGLRVVVFYLADVAVVLDRLRSYFRPIEEKDLVPESPWTFGYFGQHAVMVTPSDVVPQGVTLEDAPRFFELQVKTLFQHAWSEAEHDLGYKARESLSDDQARRFAYTAAQAWGADRAFEELRAELDGNH